MGDIQRRHHGDSFRADDAADVANFPHLFVEVASRDLQFVLLSTQPPLFFLNITHELLQEKQRRLG